MFFREYKGYFRGELQMTTRGKYFVLLSRPCLIKKKVTKLVIKKSADLSNFRFIFSCLFVFSLIPTPRFIWNIRNGSWNIFNILLQGFLISVILTGCGAMHNMPGPVRPTAVEQFLMAQAVERSLYGENIMPIPLGFGDTINLDTSGLTVEQRFFKGAIGGWLGERGLKITDSEEAKYRIHILVQSLGTEQSISFFGLPPIESVLLPIALPEIAVFKGQYQTGYTRFRLDIYETVTGKFIRSTPWFQGSTYFNEYTILFFFDFQFTDLIGPF
jgi:hypothetical protein